MSEIKLTPEDVAFAGFTAFWKAQEEGIKGKECQERCEQAIADIATLKAKRHYEPEIARLRAALEEIADAESESCRRCEGSGRLYADGKAHYPSESIPTIFCPQCGGEGRIPPQGAQEIARRALEGKGE